jgi:hypothetical protein
MHHGQPSILYSRDPAVLCRNVFREVLARVRGVEWIDRVVVGHDVAFELGREGVA